MSSTSPRTLELTILRSLADVGRQHKLSIIGRPHPRGAMENALQLWFEPEVRSRADRAFESLKARDLIRPTYSDMVDPEKWVEITDAGRNALNRGVLDALDEALLAIAPHLAEVRAGAWEAVYSSHSDALRHAAHSGRELLEQTLKEGAPDIEVESAPGFVPDGKVNGKITRRQRLQFLMQKHRGLKSSTDLKIIEEAWKLVSAVDEMLKASSHARGVPERQEIVDALAAAEIGLRALLL